jgi:hypothetical protein
MSDCQKVLQGQLNVSGIAQNQELTISDTILNLQWWQTATINLNLNLYHFPSLQRRAAAPVPDG